MSTVSNISHIGAAERTDEDQAQSQAHLFLQRKVGIHDGND